MELPLETGELIDKALDRAREATASGDAEFAQESWAAQQADALVGMAKAYLDGESQTSSGASEHYQVTVHVDQVALTGAEGRSALPI